MHVEMKQFRSTCVTDLTARLCILIDNTDLHIYKYAIKVFVIYCASYIDYVTSDAELRKGAINEKFIRRSEHFFCQFLIVRTGSES